MQLRVVQKPYAASGPPTFYGLMTLRAIAGGRKTLCRFWTTELLWVNGPVQLRGGPKTLCRSWTTDLSWINGPVQLRVVEKHYAASGPPGNDPKWSRSGIVIYSHLLRVRNYLNNYFAMYTHLTRSRIRADLASRTYLGLRIIQIIIVQCINV